MTNKTPDQVADKAINLWNAYVAGRISKEQMGAELIRYVCPPKQEEGMFQDDGSTYKQFAKDFDVR